ncbi:hypothetical protein BJ742DRAFT_835312 [Cladochytrium replicatum]|nr:hypothetical protein BJ742DRAFT_835312 [Cladochytrium replicatum]
MNRSFVTLSAIAAVLLASVSTTFAADPTQLKLLNAFRAANGVPALAEVGSLDSCAYGHTVDMANNLKQISHSGSDGSTFSSRISRCTGSGTSGENVAAGYQYVQNVMAAWQASTAHRNNMLSRNFNAVGFGSYNGYWTQNFAYINGVQPPSQPSPSPSPKPSPSPSPAARVTSGAATASPTSTDATTTHTDAPAAAEPTYIPPETGVLLDVDSDSYIIPIVSGSNGTNYDSSDGNAAIYAGDEEKLAARSSVLMAKMDASAYQLYIESKNTSVINPFLVVSFESSGKRSVSREWAGMVAVAVAVWAVGAVVA